MKNKVLWQQIKKYTLTFYYLSSSDTLSSCRIAVKIAMLRISIIPGMMKDVDVGRAGQIDTKLSQNFYTKPQLQVLVCT